MLLVLQINPLPRPITSDEQIDVSTVRPCRADADILVLVLVLVVVGGCESANDASGPILRGAFLEGNDVGPSAKDLVPKTDLHFGEIIIVGRRGCIACLGICGGRRSRFSSILAVLAEDGTSQIGRVLVPPAVIVALDDGDDDAPPPAAPPHVQWSGAWTDGWAMDMLYEIMRIVLDLVLLTLEVVVCGDDAEGSPSDAAAADDIAMVINDNQERGICCGACRLISSKVSIQDGTAGGSCLLCSGPIILLSFWHFGVQVFRFWLSRISRVWSKLWR